MTRVTPWTAAIIIIAVCVSGTTVTAVIVSGHADANSTPLIVSLLTGIATITGSLLSVRQANAAAEASQVATAKTEEIHGLVNGNYSQAVKALSDLATRGNEGGRRKTDPLPSGTPPPPLTVHTTEPDPTPPVPSP